MGARVSSEYPTMSLLTPRDPADLDRVGHSVRFYDDSAYLLDELSRFIGSALGAGDAAIVIATEQHRDGLAQRLRAHGLDLDRAMASNRYVALDAAETLGRCLVGGWPDATRFTDLVGGIITRAAATAGAGRSRVAIFGEMVALLWAEGKPRAALRLEQLWNQLAATHSFNLLCAYPMSLFAQAEDAEPLETICAEHARVIPAESFHLGGSKDERLQAITLLQQKARALRTEMEEHRKTLQSLRERNHELRQAVAARDEFLSVAAHELKTPITSLRAFAQLLLRDARHGRETAPGRLTSALAAIDLQSGKLTQLVARLLDTARIEAGKLRIEPVPTDLAALIRGVLAEQPLDVEHTFSFAGPDRLEAMVDPVRFEQVLTNLVSNAVKFSPKGGRITIELAHAAGGGVRLCVTDEGLGIPPGQREQVFKRFHQAHGERHLSGLGLGLFVAREIVELHGGTVRIEQPEHQGSRLVVTLPPTAILDPAGARS